MSMTPRLALPLLVAAQAQKEMTHNEALTLADLAVQAVVQAVGLDAPPSAPTAGQCWIVGSAPTGAWAGQDGAIAGWTAGGWRFVAPFEGMAAWSIAEARIARRRPAGWTLGPTLGPPSGGATVDVEARAAIAAIVGALRSGGLIAP